MEYETMLMLLLIVSILTGLVTEAIKNTLDESCKVYQANILAGITAMVLSVALGVGYAVLTATAINAKYAVWLIALVFLSWLSAMVGYDKVKQTITQIREG